MILNDEAHVLFIEPTGPASPTPVVDDLTRRMAEALAAASIPGYAYCGFHECSCGATSDCCDWVLPNGLITNSLAVHYLAHHREEVPAAELAKCARMRGPGIIPSQDMLHGPTARQARRNGFHEFMRRCRERTCDAEGQGTPPSQA